MNASLSLWRTIVVSLSVVGCTWLTTGCDESTGTNKGGEDRRAFTERVNNIPQAVGNIGKQSQRGIFLLDSAVDPNDSGAGDKHVSANLMGTSNMVGGLHAISGASYAFTASTGAALEDMSSGSTEIVGAIRDDAPSEVNPIGFDFWYDGVRQTSFSINSNGLMRLGVARTSSSFANSIADMTNQPQIAPYWDNIRTGDNGKAHFKVGGSAPNRKLVVEWKNEQIPRITGNPGPGAGTFQAWLWESTGVIEFVYGNGIAANSVNGGYTVGLGTSATSFAAVTTASNTVDYAAANDTQTDAIPAGTKYTFTPNIPTTTPGTLSFTSVGLNQMTLNWTDGSSNEVGYAIYRSVDGMNYDFIRQTAANVASSIETGLASNTTWFWKVVTVTEGAVSAPSIGSQATTTGTMSGTFLVGPTGMFPSLTAALASVGTNGLAGNVIFELQSTYTGVVESYPLVVNTLGSPSNTVTIRPTAGASALSIESLTAGQTIDLDGATNVIVDGRAGGTGPSQLAIRNGSLSGVAVRLVNGASRNTIQYAGIGGINNDPLGAVVLFGTSTGGTGNNDNTIDHCDIGALPAQPDTPANAIASFGSGTTALLNTGNTISNNNISNFFHATNATNGILVTTNNGGVSNTGWSILNNRIFQTAPRIYTNTTARTHRGIFVNGGNDYTIRGNVVGFANAAGAGTYSMVGGGTAAANFAGLALQGGSRGNIIQNNTIAGINFTANASTLSGISLLSGAASVLGNTIGSGTGTDSVVLGPATVPNPFLVGINLNGSATDIVLTGNTIGSLTGISSGTGGTSVFGAALVGGAMTFSNNLVGSNSTTNSIRVTGTGTGVYQLAGVLVSSATPFTITGNTFANMVNEGVGTGSLGIGIQFQGFASPLTISQNTIHHLSLAGDGSSTVGGLASVATLPYGVSITKNTIYAISATNTGAFPTIATGIEYEAGTNATLSQNTIHDIRNASTQTLATAPPEAIGIKLGAAQGTTTVSNNMISLGDGQNTTAPFTGIMNHAPTNQLNLYHNSVHLGGTAAGSLPSFAFLRGDNSAASAITSPVSILNNVFDNVRSGGGGKHYAIGNVNMVPTIGWDASASNNNVLNSADASTVGIWGLATDQTFAQWQVSSGGDALSYSGAPVSFTNASAGDLHFACGATGTVLESHGATIAGLTTDYDDQTRPGPAGSVNGGGTAPDMGADEFDCVPGNCFADSQCSDGNVCNGDEICGNGNCQPGTALDCNDNNGCTDDSCNMAMGCAHTNNTAPCDDGNACTSNDVCGGGSCNAGAPVMCDDNNGCTDDSCNMATGCVYTNNASVCDDNNACTQNDVCAAGACNGSTITCNDNNGCTDDSCDPAMGCVFTNNNESCSDGNVCNGDEACSNGACVPGLPITCAAIDECHDVGTCMPMVGKCDNPNKPNGTPCSSGTCQDGTCMVGGGGSGGAAGAGGTAGAGGQGGTGGEVGEGGSGGSPFTTHSACECAMAGNATNPSNMGAVLGALGLLSFGLRRRRF